MATTAGESVFVDTNAVVHARNADSPDHAEAKQRLTELQQSGAELWVSRQVLREFGVVVSKQMMARDAYDSAALVDEIERLEKEYLVADEDSDVTRHWKHLIRAHQVKGKPIHDANIVATMLAFGIGKLLTQNVGDFRRYEPQIEIVALSSTISKPTMTPEHFFYRQSFALESMSSALEILEAIKRLGAVTNDSIVCALWQAFFVSYAKPFTTNNEIGMISSKLVCDSQKRLHTCIMTLRHKTFGHTDHTLRADDGSQMNQVIVDKRPDGSVWPRVAGPIPAADDLSKFIQHVDDMITSIGKSVARAYDALPSQVHGLPPGSYLLDLTAPPGAQWKTLRTQGQPTG